VKFLKIDYGVRVMIHMQLKETNMMGMRHISTVLSGIGSGRLFLLFYFVMLQVLMKLVPAESKGF
jgi:hypothetical protein